MRIIFKRFCQPAIEKQTTPAELSRICVGLAGGGLTEKQTRNAMLIQTQLKDGLMVTSSKGTWRLEK